MIRPAFTEVGIFLIPFAVYALFLIASRTGLLVQTSWPLYVLARLLIGALLLVVAAWFCWRNSRAPPPIRLIFRPISTMASSSPE